MERKVRSMHGLMESLLGDGGLGVENDSGYGIVMVTDVNRNGYAICTRYINSVYK